MTTLSLALEARLVLVKSFKSNRSSGLMMESAVMTVVAIMGLMVMLDNDAIGIVSWWIGLGLGILITSSLSLAKHLLLWFNPSHLLLPL